MIIEQFHIDGFGRFVNQTFADIPPGLSVILGDNEAGKSTLLAFFRSILFGYPTRRQKEFYPPVNGGRKRGRIVLVDRKYDRVTVERSEGKGAGPATITCSDGSSASEDEFRRLLGSATASLYENVFAFSLSELQAFETLKTESIREAIYSAGIGVGRRTITQVLAELNRQASELFVPSGSKPLMNKLLARIEDLTREIREHERGVSEYQRLHAELHETMTALAQVKSQLQDARRRCARIELLQQARNDWLTLEDARTRFEALPSLPSFPDSGIRRLDELIVVRRALTGQLAVTTKEAETIRHELQSIVVDDSLNFKSDEIVRLDRGRELQEQRRTRYVTLCTELGATETKLTGILADLGEDWDAEKLRAFSLSIVQEEELETCRRQLQSIRQLIRELEPQHQVATRELHEAVDREKEVRKSFEQLPRPSLTLEAERITKLVLGRQNYESARQELPTLTQQCLNKVKNLQDTLQQVGPDWIESRLRQFDTSLAVYEKITTFKQSLNTCSSEHHTAASAVTAATHRLQEAESELARAEDVLRVIPEPPTADDSTLVERKRRIRVLQQQLRDVLQKKSRLEESVTRKLELSSQLERLQSQPNWPASTLPSWLPVVIVGIGVVGLLLLVTFRNDWIVGGTVLTITVIIAAVLFAARHSLSRRTAGVATKREHDVSHYETRIDSLNSEIDGIQQSLDATIPLILKNFKPPRQELPSLHDIEELELTADRDLDRFRQWRPADLRRNDARAVHQKRIDELSLAKSAASQKADALDSCTGQWRTWLQESGMPESLSPDEAGNLLGRLNIAREQLKAIDADRSRIDQLESSIAKYESEVEEVARLTQIPQEPAIDASRLVDTLGSLLDEQKAANATIEQARQRLNEAEAATARMHKHSESVADQLRIKYDEVHKLEENWESLLVQLALRQSLHPETFPQLRAAIERGKDQLSVVDNKSLEVDNVRQQIETYSTAVRTLASELERPVPADAELTSLVGALAVEVKKDDQLRISAEAFRQSLAKAESIFTEINEQLKQLQTDVDNLLLAADASDEEEFRTKASQYATRCELQNEMSQLETRLVRAAGSQELVVSLKSELASSTPEALSTELHEVQQVIEAKEAEVTDGASHHGRLTELIRQLESAEDLSRLRSEHQAALSELQSAADEWSLLKITAHLIDQARERYEQERRPAVLKEAERYFSRFTRGNYTHLRPSVDSDQVSVIAPNGEIKTADQLSRGTAEQLYLSLRFGFIQEFSRRSEPLPLIFDDILVNFDPQRAKAAADAILELSMSQQIFFFTCHPSTVQLIRGLDATVRVYQLRDGFLSENGAPL